MVRVVFREGLAATQRERYVGLITEYPLRECGPANSFMRLSAQPPGRVAESLEGSRQPRYGGKCVAEVVAAVMVGTPVHFQGAGGLQDGTLQHRFERSHPTDLLLCLRLQETGTEQPGHVEQEVIHVRERVGFGEERTTAPVP